MATIALTVARVSPSLTVLSWGALANGDDGAPFEWVDGGAEIWVQVIGTFGVGGSISFQGSVNGTNWVTMTRVGGTSAATFTTAGGAALNGVPRYLRHVVTSGDETTALAGAATYQRYLRA